MPAALKKPQNKLTECCKANSKYTGTNHLVHAEISPFFSLKLPVISFRRHEQSSKGEKLAQLRRHAGPAVRLAYNFEVSREKIRERFYTVCPRESESYSLGLLLLNVTEAKSSVEVRNVDGEIGSLFRQV